MKEKREQHLENKTRPPPTKTMESGLPENYGHSEIMQRICQRFALGRLRDVSYIDRKS
jgi:hypothetical protein